MPDDPVFLDHVANIIVNGLQVGSGVWGLTELLWRSLRLCMLPFLAWLAAAMCVLAWRGRNPSKAPAVLCCSSSQGGDQPATEASAERQVTYTSPARPNWGGTLVTAPKFVTGLQIQVGSLKHACP